jgi:hypothetical protein
VLLQGRRIELIYQQYFNNDYGKLETIVSASNDIGATDVLINFGVWLRDVNPQSCAWGQEGCPSIPWVCSIFNMQLPYNLRWIGTTPMVRNGTVVEAIPRGHHLDIPRVCNLTDMQVLDRASVLFILRPKASERRSLFWDGDTPHFHAEANHAFNRLLVSTFPIPVQSTRKQKESTVGLWKLLFSRGRA